MRLMQRYDFNLLVALDALLHENSVRDAADRLNLTAPATSHALARLRAAFGDPLLVRAGRRLVPTQKALAIRDQVRRVVEGGRSLLEDRAAPELADVDRTMTVRGNGSIIAVLSSRLVGRVHTKAPRMKIRFAGRDDESVGPLRNGTIDIDVGVDVDLGPEIRSRPLFEDCFVAVVRRGHPLEGAAITYGDYANADHVVPSRRGVLHGPIDSTLALAGFSRRVPVVVPDALGALAFVADTDYVATIPKSVANWAERALRIAILPLPFASQSITVYQMWHPRSDLDRAHVWLRECMEACAAAPVARADIPDS